MHRQLIYVLVFIVSLSTVTLLWPVNDSQCNSEAFLASNIQKFQVQATKVVVQPWLGEHNVYGIFMVPDKYKQAPFFVLTVKGFGHECSKPFGYGQKYDDISAHPGTHLVRDYIRTRTAMRLMLQGLYWQINDKQNWTLTYPEIQANQSRKNVTTKYGSFS
ncbi:MULTISPECIES: hypothetical protein [Calothrix]|uniref:Uncharacterized protein n=2 Tax=Calothrix TaxID=1186 RepID=A0ABR8A9H5_9CYAN|nr:MULTISPECIES: hypothetical protein [Calothrix]MBD2196518.1 hypothetical protein [Calothrix parietina FACHB-288]MBD2224587.1 hypothetical protein [Calothrix anomala FACHB-343]